jgi:hypothetical protein
MPTEFDKTVMTVTLLAIIPLNLLRVAENLPQNLSKGIKDPW